MTGTPSLKWICTNHPWEGQEPIPLSQAPSSEHPRELPEVCLTHKKKLGSSEGSFLDIFHWGTAVVPSVDVHGARFGGDKREEIVQGLGFRKDRFRSQAGI